MAFSITNCYSRLLKRGETSGRLDDNETVIRKTISVIEKCKQHHEVVTVDGRGTFDEVFQKLSAELESGIRSVR